jgi:DeoR family glycerol-3-phosphate regulon repressor
MRDNAREKTRIGEAAAKLVKDGMKVFIDTGTTALAVMKHLPNRKGVTVVSNSIAVAAHFFDASDINVRVLGGRLRPEYQAVYGHETAAALKEHFFDLAIIGISAVHLERGFMDFGEEEALLRRLACEQSRRSVVLADSTKFGRLGSVHTLSFDQVGGIITGAKLPNDFADRFASTKINVMYV